MNNVFHKMGLPHLAKNSPKYNIVSSDIGVITATDTNTFVGVQTLFTSLKEKINFICYDIGLTQDDVEWAKENKMEIRSVDYPERIKTLSKWQTYLKPWFVDDSPFEYTLWIDSDCIVVGDLSQSDFIKNRETFFVKHWIKQEYLRKNMQELYYKYPADIHNYDYINAGVFGVNKKTENNIVKDWKMIIEKGMDDAAILSFISNWDEGALNWAIQRNNRHSMVKDDYRYNCFASFFIDKKRHDFNTYHQPVYIFEKSSIPSLFFKRIFEGPESFVLHFSTCMENKSKYWSVWS